MVEKITYQEHGDTKTEFIDRYGDKLDPKEVYKALFKEYPSEEMTEKDIIDFIVCQDSILKSKYLDLYKVDKWL